MAKMKIPYLSVLSVSLIIIVLIGLSSHRSERSASLSSLIDAGFFGMNQSRTSPQNLNFFQKKETLDSYDLTYDWQDFQGHTHHINFLISRQQLSEAEDEFGYYPSELEDYLDRNLEKLNEEMMRRLERYTNQLLIMSKHKRYISMEAVSPKDFTLKLSAPPEHYEEAKEEFEMIKNRISRERNLYLKKIEKEQKKKRDEYLEKRGFRFIRDKMGVNYGFCVKKNRPRVKHIVEEMQNGQKRISLHRFLSLMLAFVQEIRYGVPPFMEEDKVILEFWIPPKVLVNNYGDCDSKAVLFASMWTNFERFPFLFIDIPNHLIVGIAIPSATEEGFNINGFRYTLLEVAGPDKVPPGLISQYSKLYLESGWYNYELIR